MKKIILLAFLFGLTGCSISPFTGERMGTLKMNMPQVEALSTAGNYDGFETMSDGTTVYKYMGRHMSGWNNYFTNYYLYFKNGQLISIKNDQPWMDNSLAENLQKVNESMQQQQIIEQNQQYLQQQAYSDFQQKQFQQRQYWQQQSYQQQQLQLDRERNQTLNRINNQLIFSK